MLRSCCAWHLAGIFLLSLGACGPDGVIRMPPGVDSGPVDSAVPVDSGDAGIPTDSGPSGDAGPDTDAGGIPVDCVWGTPMPLFETAHVVGTEVPFEAAANIEGLVVGAAARLESTYPAYSRVAVFLSDDGSMSLPESLSPPAMLMSTDLALTTSGAGFVALYNDTLMIGDPTEIFARSISSFGVAGSGPTNISNTAAGESKPSVARTSTGLVGAWLESGSGLRTAILDTVGSVVGNSQSASGLGLAARYKVFAVNGLPFIAYADSNQFVRTASIDATGAVTAVGQISASAGNTVFDVAGGPGGAGLVYELVSGSDTLIQFRAITSAGTSTTAERTLVGIGEEGFVPSIAEIAGGYVVIFRFNPATGPDTLRMVVLSSAGIILGTRDLVTPFPGGVRHAIRIAPDGDLYVIYNDLPIAEMWGTDSVMSATVRALKVVCQ